jgi:hypothetical protein
LAAQVLTLLDAFIFPESLDEALPASQLHGLELVRHAEPRLGNSQGPLIASAIRLSLLLLELLEPSSVKMLQCASRMKCLLHWALELIRESNPKNGQAMGAEESFAQLDLLVIAIVVHSHRALGRCSALLSEIESSPFEKYFTNKESQKKHHRRILRVALELRDVVLTAYRGRDGVIRSTLSINAFQALRVSLESASSPGKSTSKETVARDWLSSSWVCGFRDVETRKDLAIPEQMSMDSIPLSSEQNPSANGVTAIEQLANQSVAIISDFEKALNGSFEEFLETQRKWTETDAVRELESDGDTTANRLSEKYRNDSSEVTKTIILRRSGADNRWRGIHRKAVDPWKHESHWRLAPYTDDLGRRTLLVQNRHFDPHKAASYELMLGKEHDKGEQEKQFDEDLSAVIRRNIEAFTITESMDDVDARDDISSGLNGSDGEESSVEEANSANVPEIALMDEAEYDDEWDKIDSEEIKDVDAEGDIDGWAKAFIWSENEFVVARFDHVMIVSLQVYTEGKLLLTTHGLYFHQIGNEMSVMTKEPVETLENALSDSKFRRWRLSRLTAIHGRRSMLRQQALELFFSDSHELFLDFPGGVKERDRFHAKLRNSCRVSAPQFSFSTIWLVPSLPFSCHLGTNALVAEIVEPA